MWLLGRPRPDSCQRGAARATWGCVWAPWQRLPPGSSGRGGGGRGASLSVSRARFSRRLPHGERREAPGAPRPLCGGAHLPPGRRAPRACFLLARRARRLVGNEGDPRPRGARGALCPSRARAFCVLPRLSSQGWEGLCTRQSARKKERKKSVKTLCNPNTPAPHPRKCLLNNGGLGGVPQ